MSGDATVWLIGYPVELGMSTVEHIEDWMREFQLMALPPGKSKNTIGFKPAGKTCDYFVWDVNWSRMIFVGQVVVQ